MSKRLYELDKALRYFLASFVLLLTIAVSTGFIFIFQTTSFSNTGVVERYSGCLSHARHVALES